MKLRIAIAELRAKAVALALLAPLCIALAACGPIHETARDVIAGSAGVLTAAQAQYGAACKADPQQPRCQSISRGIAAQGLAIDALHLYCASESYERGGPCTPHKELEPKLRQAVRSLERMAGEVKELL
ncbi:MAG: hypothetical protein ACRD2R_03555 [Terriglobales bacterium]